MSAAAAAQPVTAAPDGFDLPAWRLQSVVADAVRFAPRLSAEVHAALVALPPQAQQYAPDVRAASLRYDAPAELAVVHLRRASNAVERFWAVAAGAPPAGFGEPHPLARELAAVRAGDMCEPAATPAPPRQEPVPVFNVPVLPWPPGSLAVLGRRVRLRGPAGWCVAPDSTGDADRAAIAAQAAAAEHPTDALTLAASLEHTPAVRERLADACCRSAWAITAGELAPGDVALLGPAAEVLASSARDRRLLDLLVESRAAAARRGLVSNPWLTNEQACRVASAMTARELAGLYPPISAPLCQAVASVSGGALPVHLCAERSVADPGALLEAIVAAVGPAGFAVLATLCGPDDGPFAPSARTLGELVDVCAAL